MIINDYTHKNEYNALRENYLQQSKIISGLNTDNYKKNEKQVFHKNS